jgi:hypothetical protein
MRAIPDSYNTSGAKGVCWDRRNKKWYVQIRVGDQQFFLGRFSGLPAAVAAYQRAFKLRAVVLQVRNRAEEIRRERFRANEQPTIAQESF